MSNSPSTIWIKRCPLCNDLFGSLTKDSKVCDACYEDFLDELWQDLGHRVLGKRIIDTALIPQEETSDEVEEIEIVDLTK